MPTEVSLLNAIAAVLSKYIEETNPVTLFNGLLSTLLVLTESEYGFIGEIIRTPDGTPSLKNYATTNIAWNEDTRALYKASQAQGMVFANQDSLYGAVLKTGLPVIANTPGDDPRSGGLPPGHPPLNAFLGIPLLSGGNMLGVIGLANRVSGYQSALIDRLEPFLVTCVNLIKAYQNNTRHRQVNDELQRYRARISVLEETVALGHGYEFNPAQASLSREGRIILLTKKESALLAYMVMNINQIVTHAALEDHIWQNVCVGESSLRSLLRRLRVKLPDLDIKTISGVGYLLSTSD